MRSDIFKLGIEKSPQRALLKGMGFIGEEIANPFIGLISSYNEMSPGHRHLRDLTQAVKDGVRLAGGTPIEINTVTVCDGIALGHTGINYALASREIVADSIETIVGVHGFDAIILIPNCEKVVSGMLMGAARVNIPCILVTGGAAVTGHMNGQSIDLASMFDGVRAFKDGDLSYETLSDMEDKACPGCGACAGMPNAHSMTIAAEALGMTWPGNSTCPSGHAMLSRIAKKAGMKIIELLSRNVKPSQIITEKALLNALAVDAATGGSPSVLLHLRAIANELGLTIRQEDINTIYANVPLVCQLRPDGCSQVTDIHEAGGIVAIETFLADHNLFDNSAVGIYGKPLRELVGTDAACSSAFAMVTAQERASLATAAGSLTPEGAVITWKGIDNPAYFSGPAKVFDSEEQAANALQAGKIAAGSVMVIRYEGPRGGPGMQEMAAPLSVFNSEFCSGSIALVTDGRLSGWYKGLAVQHASPEAAVGGPIAFVKDGDMISIDTQNHVINLAVSSHELAARAKSWVQPPLKVRSGYLAKYARLVSSAAAGAVTS